MVVIGTDTYTDIERNVLSNKQRILVVFQRVPSLIQHQGGPVGNLTFSQSPWDALYVRTGGVSSAKRWKRVLKKRQSIKFPAQE